MMARGERSPLLTTILLMPSYLMVPYPIADIVGPHGWSVQHEGP